MLISGKVKNDLWPACNNSGVCVCVCVSLELAELIQFHCQRWIEQSNSIR